MTIAKPVTAELQSPRRNSSATKRSGVSLFWRTFFLLSVLLAGSVWAWTETLHELEFEPRALHAARQIASVVNLSRAAVMHTDGIARVSLFKTMKDQEHVTIQLREPKDQFEPYDSDDINLHVTKEIQARLGADSIVARSVNKVEGLWVGFSIENDQYWLRTERSRFDEPAAKTWVIWILTTAALSLAGAAWIASLINRPLKDLSKAAQRVREGDFEASTLDENVSTQEIRAVNVGFNRMTRKLAKVEQDRAVMLAGISHDLRTPLARLRLEAELSVADPVARNNMAADIEQLDAIIDKFLDYARPGGITLQPVSLNQTIETCLAPMRKRQDITFKVALQDGLLVDADPVELQRVIDNLLQNAARYGKGIDTGIAMVDISARYQDNNVLLRVRDHGAGVAPEQLKQLTTPFFRGEAARTSANGTGLGLAIVEKTLSRMGCTFELSNANSGGLCANIKLQRATARLA
ncbi:MAG: ATP-binding protein [Rhodoferax sp.]|uniref:sensor histidine kinase n=1 Tax=Rhodoferax sp. TaxID=50421 RepID=UPI0026228F75|nr:sensor histidine kinase [Rhodoferax sp.]MDD2879313.1 ATP-binding protein [Rhodoferax sp.]